MFKMQWVAFVREVITPIATWALFIGLRNGIFGYRVIQIPREAGTVRLDEGFLWAELKWYPTDEDRMSGCNYVVSLFPIRVERKD